MSDLGNFTLVKATRTSDKRPWARIEGDYISISSKLVQMLRKKGQAFSFVYSDDSWGIVALDEFGSYKFPTTNARYRLPKGLERFEEGVYILSWHKEVPNIAEATKDE